MTRGHALGSPARLCPFPYSSIVFAGLFGWLLGGEIPDPLPIAGAVLIRLAGILALRPGEVSSAEPHPPKGA